MAGVGEIEIGYVAGDQAVTGQADDAAVIRDGHVLGPGSPKIDAVCAPTMLPFALLTTVPFFCAWKYTPYPEASWRNTSPLLTSVLPLKLL